MRGQRAVVVTLAMAAAALFVFALWHLGDWCVDRWYLSESAVQARNDKAAEGLRAFAIFPLGYPAEERQQLDRFEESRIHYIK